MLQNSPAERCGARQGDVIVTVDDWLITIMDKPQVNLIVVFNFIIVKIVFFRLLVICFKQAATWLSSVL